MINLLKKLYLLKKNKLKLQDTSINSDIKDEIKQICLEMEKTNRWFQMEVDTDLIEACIHQREVLNARYKYLINKLKPEKIKKMNI